MVKCLLDNKECVWGGGGCIITLTEFPIDRSSTTFQVLALSLSTVYHFCRDVSHLFLSHFRFSAQQIQNCNLVLKGSPWKFTK